MSYRSQNLFTSNSHLPGHQALTGREVIPTIASILTDLCAVNDKQLNQVISKFHAASDPNIPIQEYLERIQKFADCSDTCFILALIYIDRIQAHPNFTVCTLNIHRLLITSVMVSAKFFDDNYYNNAFYARIGGVSKEEMNQLELEFLFMIAFGLSVTEAEYLEYDTELRAHSMQRLSMSQQLSYSQQATPMDWYQVGGSPVNDSYYNKVTIPFESMVPVERIMDSDPTVGVVTCNSYPNSFHSTDSTWLMIK